MRSPMRRDEIATCAWMSTGMTKQMLSDTRTVQTTRARVAAGAGARFLHLEISAL
jgi:hypothetical protein